LIIAALTDCDKKKAEKYFVLYLFYFDGLVPTNVPVCRRAAAALVLQPATMIGT